MGLYEDLSARRSAGHGSWCWDAGFGLVHRRYLIKQNRRSEKLAIIALKAGDVLRLNDGKRSV